MSAKVLLHLHAGSDAGKVFAFAEHDTFVFGRMEDCHACFPDDGQVSRHHFILEVNPPAACLRDLGSLNGTYVNGKKFGARAKDETPEQGAQRRYPEVALCAPGIMVQSWERRRHERLCTICDSRTFSQWKERPSAG